MLNKTKKIAIIQSVFYHDLSKMLLDGAIQKTLQNHFDYDIFTVNGALEIPSAISILANINIPNQHPEYEGFVALGCVIRGKTSHYEIVCNESARGLMNLGISKNLAIGNGIITTENYEQAEERANLNKLNKGGFAVDACLSLINLKYRK